MTDETTYHVDCGTLLTGDGETIEDARVLVTADRVETVGTQEDVPEVGDRVDHSGETVLPGLIDAHLHLQGSRTMDPMDWVTESTALGTARATADLRSLLSAGFTSVRDVGSTTGLGLRDAVAAGEIPGPRIYTSGQAISQTGGHGDSHSLPHEWVVDTGIGISTLADGADECRKEARKRVRDGVDCLKIMTTGGVLSERDAPDQSQFTDREVQALVEEAHRVGIPVASHAQGTAGVERALENGVDTIEHGFYLEDRTLELFVQTDATFVPTMAIMHRIVEYGADHGVPEHGLRKAREAYEAHVDSITRAHEAGVAIATGTDFLGPALVPHGENALELELLVEEIGFDEQAAIEAATGVAARTVPGDDVGVLEAGRYADFVVADDPLSDVGSLREPVAVYKGGKRVEL
ncbi:amidohydrolase family protein [Salinirubellus salinus]|uniref:Amidohydrolase family protein n=1 Tax=Salinirubellus salinus TaxID=1364945 RepID=A0A9E7UA14_9EURY|nr:amidohydrolase family protein [Salinirubellus salinus]UWM53733.1 amidohydrolase family protein [Salinirubellus salinus]